MIGIAGNDHARAALILTATDGSIHEIKHDGFRLQIHVRSARARLTMTGWIGRTASWFVEDATRLKIAWRHGYGSPATSLPSSILRLIAPPLWRSWSWRCRQLPADYHAIAFATAFIARHPIPEPGGFAGLARYRNFFVHAL